MAYSTPAMVRNALRPSSDGGVGVPNPVSNTAADFTDAELNDAIAEADSTINGYLSGRYTTPVADGTTPGVPPHPIDYWSRNIAAYNATLTFRGSQDFTDTDPIARRYKDTMEALKAVESGKMNLPLPENEGGAGSSVGAAAAFNPYIGDLWTPDDFSINSSSPVSGWGPFWFNPSGL